VGPPERLKDVGKLVGWDADTGILDRDLQAVRNVPGDDRDRSPLRRVANGVVDQRVGHPGEARRAGTAGRIPEIDLDRDALGGRGERAAAHSLADEIL